MIDWQTIPAAIWRVTADKRYLRPVVTLHAIQFTDLLGIDRQINKIKLNTEQFLAGQGANHALLWGARGTGKSSIIKALLNEYQTQGLRVIQVDKDHLIDLPEIVDEIRDQAFHYIVYCDDLSFEAGQDRYKALKSTLEGTIEAPPDNVLVYVTSNRRHLLPQQRQDNLAAQHIDGELHQGDALEEKLSLAERFGLNLAFHPLSQIQYLTIIKHLAGKQYDEALEKRALRYALERGSRSARIAQQFQKSLVR